jgi:hypothetical protein
MKITRSFLIMAIATLICMATSGAAPQAKIDFPVAGFSIAPLEVAPGDNSRVALAMSLDGSDGFAANVNVMIQPFQDTMDSYLAITKQQFDQLQATVVQENKLDDHTVVIEYTATMQGRNLHFYSKMIQRPKHVYLVTATALDVHWQDQGQQLKDCVDSFALDQSAQ